MLSTDYRTPRPVAEMKRHNSYESPFDHLALECDAWFDKEGSLIFFIEVQAFTELLPTLPKPWLEVGVGSGRFAFSKAR